MNESRIYRKEEKKEHEDEHTRENSVSPVIEEKPDNDIKAEESPDESNNRFLPEESNRSFPLLPPMLALVR